MSEHDNETKDSWIKLNIGGKVFMTSKATLCHRESDSMLAKLVTSYHDDIVWSSSTDETGAILIDRSPEYFEPLLNYLRHGRLILDKHVNPVGVMEEAKFYGIQGVQDELAQLIVLHEGGGRNESAGALTRCDVIRFLAGTVSGTRVRLQGLDFSSADLSQLDLSGANLSHCRLRNANLQGANMCSCVLTRTDCSGAVFDKANMSGVQMRCATLDKASMVGVFLEASNQHPAANLEGSSLREANLENSHLQEVNLRVACLKKARLIGCNLRAAVLAGSDLENADLSGSDLQQANLRGANVINCIFGDLRSPLHMAQTLNTLTS